MTEERDKRNQVFSGEKSIDQGVQQVSMIESVKTEFGLDIPIETVPLPSGGKVYPIGHALHMAESVDIRAMTTREEDILTSQALLKRGVIISELIKSCLTNKAIDPTSLLAGDRNALLIAIRITGYGAEYDAEVTCDSDDCDYKGVRTFDLMQLPIQRLTIEPTELGQNVFEFKLPYSEKIVKFRFILGSDEEEIRVTEEKQKKLGLAGSNTVSTGLIHSIISVSGVSDRSKIAQFVRNMPARDSLALREYIRKNEPGIKMKQESTCPVCGHVSEVTIPLGVNFLWPGVVG